MLSPLARIPVLRPPPGVKSDFDNPSDTLARPITIVNGVFVSLSFLTVLVRVVTRKFISRQGLAWDDGLSVFAMLGSIVHTTLSIINIDIGYGRHMWDIRAISLSEKKIMQLASIDIIYSVVIFVIKLSLLLQYYRLFSTYTSSRRLIHGGILLCVIITLPYVGIAIARTVICSSYTIITDHITFCFTRQVNTTIATFGALNVISDFYILAIPLSRIKKLTHVTHKKRIGLVAVFTVGLGACIMSIVRLVSVAVHFDNGDTLYNGAYTSIFSCVEMNLAIICSCSISFPSFYRSVRKAIDPMLRSLSGVAFSRSSNSKSNKSNPFELNAHGLIESRESEQQKDSLEPMVRPVRVDDLPPHVSLNMTRPTIDMGTQRSGRFG